MTCHSELISLDISLPYTNIQHEDGLQAIIHAGQELEHRTAMGTHMAPAYANKFMLSIEKIIRADNPQIQ